MSTTPESEARFLADAVRSAASARRKLRILGSGSKQFYPAAIEGDVLRVAGYCGIVDYDPAELVLTKTFSEHVPTTVMTCGPFTGAASTSL